MRLFATFIAIAIAVFAGVGVVLAHGGAMGVVKERMELMKGMGEAMKQLTAVFRGQVEYDAETVRAAARTINSRSGEHITRLFPDGSLDKPSEALPAIWTDWAKFEQYANDVATYSAVLEASAENDRGPMHGGAMESQGGMMGQAPHMMEQGSMMGGQGAMMPGQAAGAGAGMPMAGPMNEPDALKAMPPQASFMHLAQTCNACHTEFRVKKQ